MTDEIITELCELARMEGCETGDLVFNLLELREGYSDYMSSDFVKSIDDELNILYRFLKTLNFEY